MKKITVFKRDYVTELVKIIRNAKNAQTLQRHLSNYHDKDIAEAITKLSETERMRLYTMIDIPRLAEIFSYLDDAKPYLNELSLDKAARVISDMDADDALDILDEFFYRNFFTSCFYFLLPELFYTRFLFHILGISNIWLKSYAFPLYMHQRSEQTTHCNDGIGNNRWCAHLPSQP